MQHVVPRGEAEATDDPQVPFAYWRIVTFGELWVDAFTPDELVTDSADW